MNLSSLGESPEISSAGQAEGRKRKNKNTIGEMDQEIQFHAEEGISDDVSALSMDGASAIAGLQASGFAKRMRKNYSSGNFDKGMDILEEDENDEVESQPRSRRSASHRQYGEINNGEELIEPFPDPERIEPFPKTYEEWQEKKNKEKKEKRKQKKKHKHKKISKTEGRSRSENDLDGVDVQQVQPPVTEISVGGDSNPYHSTGSVSSRRQNSHVSVEARSCTPSVASTQDESLSSYHHSGSRRTSATLGSAGNISATSPNHRESSMSRVLRRQSEMLASLNSMDSREGSNRESIAGVSATSRSNLTHVSAEKMEALHAKLSKAIKEEEQVVDIHSRLEVEVEDAEEQSSRAKMQLANIEEELAMANLEREQLQSQLKFIQDENTRLLRKLRNIEDEEQEERLDSLMNDMNHKMKVLKMKSSKTRVR